MLLDTGTILSPKMLLVLTMAVAIHRINICKGSALPSIYVDFIKRQEGFLTDLYVAQWSDGSVMGKGGVLVGMGVCLCDKDRNYFEGLPATLLDKIQPYYGLWGNESLNFVKEKPSSLTEDEANWISDFTVDKFLVYVEEIYDKATSGKKYCELTTAQRTVVFDVVYQYGNPRRTPKFWGFVTKQDWSGAIGELRDFGDSYHRRRWDEAELLENDKGSGRGIGCPSTFTPTPIPPPHGAAISPALHLTDMWTCLLASCYLIFM